MQKSVQARKNRIISAMSGQFQSELPIFKMNGSIINKDLRKVKMNTFSITYYLRKFGKYNENNIWYV